MRSWVLGFLGCQKVTASTRRRSHRLYSLTGPCKFLSVTLRVPRDGLCHDHPCMFRVPDKLVLHVLILEALIDNEHGWLFRSLHKLLPWPRKDLLICSSFPLQIIHVQGNLLILYWCMSSDAWFEVRAVASLWPNLFSQPPPGWPYTTWCGEMSRPCHNDWCGASGREWISEWHTSEVRATIHFFHVSPSTYSKFSSIKNVLLPRIVSNPNNVFHHMMIK